MAAVNDKRLEIPFRDHSQRGLRHLISSYLPVMMRVMLVALALLANPVLAAGNRATCFQSTGSNAVSACRSELASNPRNKRAYLALGNHLDRQGRYAESVKIYRKGLRYFPEDAYLTKRLEIAESNLKEKEWLVDDKNPIPPIPTPAIVSAQLRLAEIRCKTLVIQFPSPRS